MPTEIVMMDNGRMTERMVMGSTTILTEPNMMEIGSKINKYI